MNKLPKLKTGDRIPGSILFRDFCVCGEPMRVTESKVGMAVLCERCSGHGNIVGNPHFHKDEDANGGWSNVVRAGEDE